MDYQSNPPFTLLFGVSFITFYVVLVSLLGITDYGHIRFGIHSSFFFLFLISFILLLLCVGIQGKVAHQSGSLVIWRWLFAKIGTVIIFYYFIFHFHFTFHYNILLFFSSLLFIAYSLLFNSGGGYETTGHITSTQTRKRIRTMQRKDFYTVTSFGFLLKKKKDGLEWMICTRTLGLDGKTNMTYPFFITFII